MKFILLTKEYISKNIERFIDLSKQLDDDYWTLENYTADLNEKWLLSTGIEEDNKLIAFLIGSNKNSSLHVHRIVVSAAYKGKGLGKKLIMQLAEEAKRRSIKFITLKVHRNNSSAQEIYIKLGFVLESVSEKYSAYKLHILY